MVLALSRITTPLGTMVAVADDTCLYLLAFEDQQDLAQELEKLAAQTRAKITPGSNTITQKISHELNAYFAGKLTTFTTPVKLLGTPFQHKVWQALQTVPFGKTVSYAQIAQVIGAPTSFRAVANANGANRLPVLIPCHRVIKSDGDICGYNGGLSRKAWLLEHEQNKSKRP